MIGPSWKSLFKYKHDYAVTCRNAWNEGKPVYICRDGTEVEPAAGAELVALIDQQAKRVGAPAPRKPLRPGNPSPAGGGPAGTAAGGAGAQGVSPGPEGRNGGAGGGGPGRGMAPPPVRDGAPQGGGFGPGARGGMPGGCTASCVSQSCLYNVPPRGLTMLR